MPQDSRLTCPCQDSNGIVCGKKMTKQEAAQDGMCSNCADNVWFEMHSNKEHKWYHNK